MMKQSLNEAELAIDSAKCQGLDDTITRYKDIGIYSLLFSVRIGAYYKTIFQKF